MGRPMKIDLPHNWPVGETASATDFVRHFGQHSLRSLQHPVYIAQHGRINWALVSADLMTRMAAAETDDFARDARFDMILDSISAHVTLLDDNLDIVVMNAPARRHFQVSESISRTLNFAALIKNPNGIYVLEACKRVRDSGNSETFELDSTRYPGRTLRFHVMPTRPGVVMTAEVVSQAVQVRRAYAAAAAAASAADITNLLGRGSVNVRGTITGANQTLATLAGTTTEKIIGLRLTSLFEQESRDTVRDHIESLLTNGEPFSLDVSLLDGTEKNAPVRLGVAVERDGGAICGAAFIAMSCP